jgi:coenzyme F420-reducing hydrogenase delta subunit
MRLIRVMCSGRVDLEFVFRAFSNGMDGVFIGGCRLNECNYLTQGNYHALGMVFLCRKLLAHMGLSPERLKLAFMSAGDGMVFAEITNGFVDEVRALGPLGRGEGLAPETVRLKLEALTRLIPYIRLVEREKLRVPERSEEAYRAFFASEEIDRVLQDAVFSKLAVSEIALLLRERPLPTAEIAGTLGLSPSEVSRHLNSSSRQGLVRYDAGRKCYALA